MRNVKGFMFWVLLGLGIVIIPIACASDNNGNDASGTGGSSNVDMAGKADALTKT
jgi:hypothetical protein